ncbi:MAG TPA: HD domain-containing phosphohydrolase [Egibacteraceae bacterium]|nr:HD domain-containing phosphohydrolase [Egibacteraceae bacterium]
MGSPGEVRVSELVACLALATDLGMGQPLDHGLRTCLLALGVGQALGLTDNELADVYSITLLRFVGCNAHAHQDALETGDELAFRAGVAPILSGGTPEMLRFTITDLGKGWPPATRARMIAGALAAGSKGARETIAATCEAAQMVAARLGMGVGVVSALGATFERHDGKGFPHGTAGEEIPIAAHVAMVARDFEVLHRLGGRDLAVDLAARRRGRAYAPKVVDAFLAHGFQLLDDARSESSWDAVIAADPSPRVLRGDGFDDALKCLGDFADIKSRYTHGYSRAVAELATQAATASGLSAEETAAVGAAALVQELGMTGVSNSVLEKQGPLTEGEWERVRLHPYLTERILARCEGLSSHGSVAAAHHERMDAGGYHRGLAGSQLPQSARLVAAAGAYVAMASERPWRPAMASREAAAELRDLATSGGFDAAAAEAVLAAAGEKGAPRRRTWPAGLTDREVEVLRLISQGRSNRQVASQLVISPKTVGRHVENIYAKAGISTRAGAAVFALHHGLAPPPGAMLEVS